MMHCGIGIVLNKRHEVLLAKRREDDSLGGYWEFPGGQQEANETLEACVVRELREETGLDIKILQEFCTIINPYLDKELSLYFYLCERIGGEPQALESQRVCWASIPSLIDYQFPPANELIIKKLLQYHSIHSLG